MMIQSLSHYLSFLFLFQSFSITLSQSFSSILNGDTLSPVTSYAIYFPGGGVGGTTALLLQPDPYHSPSITLAAPLWRADMTPYLSLDLDVLCPTLGTPLTLKFNRWTSTGVGSDSQTITLSNYLTTGTSLSNTWNHVSIPLTALSSTNWPTLSGVERIYFNLDSKKRGCYVDNVVLMKKNLQTVSPTLQPTKATPQPSTAKPTRPQVDLPPINLVTSFGIDPLYDGEANSFMGGAISYAQSLPGVGISGSMGLKLTPDAWHSPSIVLPPPIYRSAVSHYDELILYVRCEQDGTPLSLHLGSWFSSTPSNKVYLGKYAVPADIPVGSTISTVWTQVRIPVSDLSTTEWNLNAAETLYFNSDNLNRVCYADNIYFRTARVPSTIPTSTPSFVPTPQPSTAMPTRTLPENIEPYLTEVLGVQPLFDGETDSFQPSDIRYAKMSPGTGVLGTVGLELHPDKWHSPTFLLSEPIYRDDIAAYNEMLLYARCSIPDTPLSVHFGRWIPAGSTIGGTSASVYLGSFAEPLDIPAKTTIGTTWTKVRIPIPAFFTENWKLAGAEWVYFNSDDQNRVCWIDNVLLRENVGPYVVDATLLTETVISVELNKYFHLESARDVNKYSITVDSTTFSPESIGLVYRFQDFKDNSFVPRSRYHINLIFSSPFDCTRTYIFKMANVTDPALNDMTPADFQLNCPIPVVSKSIKVNQLGYLPERRKLAYVGDYFGDNGGGVWVVGAQSSIWYWSRLTHIFTKAENLPTTLQGTDLYAVTAISPNDVWVVGSGGSILHFDGLTWISVPSPTSQNLYAIDFSPDRSNGFIVGASGTILQFIPNSYDSHGQWISLNSPTTNDLRCVWVGSTIAWAGGSKGTMLRFLPTTPPTRSPTSYPTKQSNQPTVKPTRAPTAFSSWVLTTTLTDATILAIEGVRTDYAVSAICDNGLMLTNQWGSWVLGQQLESPVKSFFLNPTFLKSGRAVGADGKGFAFTPDGVFTYNTNTQADLNAIVMVEEKIAFAFGENGECRTGSSIDMKNWLECHLPSPTTVFGATALMEGPLRLPYPRPMASLQLMSSTGDWNTFENFDVKLQTMNYHLSGEDVFVIDFSAVQNVGTYRIKIEGVGVSDTFIISPEALDKAAYHTCRMLYYQRSGMALQAPYAESRFTRPIDHEFDTSPGGRRIDGAYHWSIKTSPLYDGEVTCPLNATLCPEESFRDGSGGWFDAGDYSKYTATGTPTVWRLLTALDILDMHHYPLTDDLNIPESNDGTPDFLNEAQWEINWMMKMQKDDGGVFNKLASELWESGPPETADLGGRSVRYFLPRTTHDTATTGAVFALASRLWGKYNPSLSQTLLQRAVLAWKFLERYPNQTPIGGPVNPPGHISGPYGDTDDTDNRAWLNAELYRTTCNQTFGQLYVDYVNEHGVSMGGNDFTDYGIEGVWAFLESVSCPSEPPSFLAARSKARSALLSSVNGNKNRALGNTYRNVGRTDVPEWVGWGSTTLTGAQFWGILGWHAFQDTTHLDWLSLHLDTVLGANPLSLSYITGLGYRYPMDPLQGQSRSDNVAEPIPGYVVMGPFAHVSFMSPTFAVAQGDRSNYPKLTQLTSPFPVLRRWADSNLLPQYNEGGVGPASIQCAAFQILSMVSKQQL